MPRAGDAPMFESGFHPVPAKTNPLGAKGCGEAGCTGVLPSMMNTLVDALAECGVGHTDMLAHPGARLARDKRGARRVAGAVRRGCRRATGAPRPDPLPASGARERRQPMAAVPSRRVPAHLAGQGVPSAIHWRNAATSAGWLTGGVVR